MEHNLEIVDSKINKNIDCEQSGVDTQFSSGEETIHFDSSKNRESSMESEDKNPDEFEGRFQEELEEDRKIQKLRQWAVVHKICQSYLDELLQILRCRLLPIVLYPKLQKHF